jgi:transposase
LSKPDYKVLELATGQQITLRSAMMKAETSALFLNWVLASYLDKPISLLWDRTPWHKGEAIRSVLSANPRLCVLWFPPGCPELNPQEHVWKAAREAVSHNHQFAKLPE